MRQEVIAGERGLRAHIWEAMLYRYFSELRFEFRRDMVLKAGQQGPDFGLLHGGRTIWVEAIVPAPEGIPTEYLRTPKVGEVILKTVPHQEKLLRWTAALKEKRQKFQRYVENRTIPPTDPTVIAINGCRLADWSADDNGVSRMPLAVEATFPVGPIAVPISRDGQIDGEARRTPRYSIQNANGSDVRTDSFLNPLYANVSAVIGAVKWDMLKPLPLTVVRNPLAAVPLPKKIFAATKEYVADDQGDEYLLRPLTEPSCAVRNRA
jgi:type I restriction enzyme S subunit